MMISRVYFIQIIHSSLMFWNKTFETNFEEKAWLIEMSTHIQINTNNKENKKVKISFKYYFNLFFNGIWDSLAATGGGPSWPPHQNDPWVSQKDETWYTSPQRDTKEISKPIIAKKTLVKKFRGSEKSHFCWKLLILSKFWPFWPKNESVFHSPMQYHETWKVNKLKKSSYS